MMTCSRSLRAGKTCGRPEGHSGQHRTAWAMQKRNTKKRLDTERAAFERDLDGGRDGRRRTMTPDELVEDIGWKSDDPYLAAKRAAGLID